MTFCHLARVTANKLESTWSLCDSVHRDPTKRNQVFTVAMQSPKCGPTSRLRSWCVRRDENFHPVIRCQTPNITFAGVEFTDDVNASDCAHEDLKRSPTSRERHHQRCEKCRRAGSYSARSMPVRTAFRSASVRRVTLGRKL